MHLCLPPPIDAANGFQVQLMQDQFFWHRAFCESIQRKDTIPLQTTDSWPKIPNIEIRFHCPQASLSFNFKCKKKISELH